MTLTDYIPHGMVTAFAGVVTFVFRQHTKQDDDRYALLNTALNTITTRQQEISDKMADNHAEILTLLIDAGHHRATYAAITENAINRDRPPGRDQA